MTSPARIMANRLNALRSTGPKTVAGKLQAAQNGRNSGGPRTASGKLRAAQNAQKSTGPATEAGKKRSAQNAWRHGLTVPATDDPFVASCIADLSGALAAVNEHPEVFELGLRIAVAQANLMRARRAWLDLLARKADVGRLVAIERYTRRARGQRALAMRAFDTATAGSAAAAQSHQAELSESSEPKPQSCENELNQTQRDKTN